MSEENVNPEGINVEEAQIEAPVDPAEANVCDSCQ